MSKTTSTAKYRIFELEKEFNQSSQTIIDFLKKRKIKVANRFSAIDEDAYAILQESLPKRNKPLAETKPIAKQEKTSPKNNNRNRRNKFGGQKQDSIRLVNYDDKPKQANAKTAETKTQLEKVETKVAVKVDEVNTEIKVEEKVAEGQRQKLKSRRKNLNLKLKSRKKFPKLKRKPNSRSRKIKIVAVKKILLPAKKILPNAKRKTDAEKKIIAKTKLTANAEKIKLTREANAETEIIAKIATQAARTAAKRKTAIAIAKTKMLPMPPKLNSNRLKIKLNKAVFHARKKLPSKFNSRTKLKLQDRRTLKSEKVSQLKILPAK